MRILVCGGRAFGDVSTLKRTLDALLTRYGAELEILQGAARGADLMAEEWARNREVPYIGVPALWAHLGKAAGPERNERMLAKYRPEAAVAFPGGPGTADMVAKLKRAGIPVWEVGGK